MAGEVAATPTPSSLVPVSAAAPPVLVPAAPRSNRLYAKLQLIRPGLNTRLLLINQLTTPSFPTSPSYPALQPVTWASLGLMAVTGAGLAFYYQGEKEKKQQQGTVS